MRFRTTYMALLAVAIAVAAHAQEPNPSANGSPRVDEALEWRLQKEARRVENEPASDLLATIRKASDRGFVGSAEQSALCGRLDDLTRAVLRAYLLRDVGGNPKPKDLDERLSENGRALRQRVVMHADAIALQGILKAGQVVRIHGKRPRPAPILVGRYALPPNEVGVSRPESADGILSAVQSQAAALERKDAPLSHLFLILILPQQAKYRAGIGLSAEQTALVRRLDELTRAVLRAWLVRGIGNATPPDDLPDRISEPGQRLRASVVAHAEAILLEGILTTDQAQRLRAALWKQKGIDALFDPDLASTLGLSKSQWNEILLELQRKAIRIDEISASSLHELNAPEARSQPDLIAKLVSDRKAQFQEAEQPIWELLTPSQSKTLVKLLYDDLTTARRPLNSKKGRKDEAPR